MRIRPLLCIILVMPPPQTLLHRPTFAKMWFPGYREYVHDAIIPYAHWTCHMSSRGFCVNYHINPRIFVWINSSRKDTSKHLRLCVIIAWHRWWNLSCLMSAIVHGWWVLRDLVLKDWWSSWSSMRSAKISLRGFNVNRWSCRNPLMGSGIHVGAR